MAKVETQTQNLATALEQLISSIFNKTDLTLQTITDEAEKKLMTGQIDWKSLCEFENRQHSRVPEITNIQLIQSNGDMVALDGGKVKILTNIADRKHFITLKQNSNAGLVFSEPIFGRVNKKWILIVGRRISNPDGSCAGVVQATIAIDYLNNLFSLYELGKHGVITLRGLDLGVIARYPLDQSSKSPVGSKVVSKRFQDLIKNGKQSGTYYNPGSIDPVGRIFSYRKVSQYPFYVNSGLASQDYLSDWRRDAWLAASFCLLFALISSFSALLMFRKWQLACQVEQDLQRSGEQLEAQVVLRTVELKSANNRLYKELAQRKVIEAALHEKAQLLETEMGEHQIANEALQVKTLELESQIEEREAVQQNLEEQTAALEEEINERLRIEEEHLQLEEQLRQSQKMEAIGLLAGGVAHDFNNILSVIMGYSELLINRLTEGKEHDNAVHILKATERAAELTKGLLAFSRKQNVVLERTDIIKLVDDNCTFLKRIIGEDIKLITTYPVTPLFVSVDRAQIQHVFMNLATNARDAMPSGGELTISVDSINIDDTFIALYGGRKLGLHTVIRVSDTGTGIKKEMVGRIFEPFFTTKEKGKGTGLGLSMIHGTIAQHNGFILCNSKLGQGTTFSIYLPINGEHEENTAPAAVVEEYSRKGSETILLAEDDQMLMEITSNHLETRGYRVLKACDGSEAVDIFKVHGNEIDLVILDAIMPKMNGKQAWEAIHAMRPEVKACFVSGYTNEVMSGKIAVDYSMPFISKPIMPEALQQKIREILDEVH
jgi:signal transduction histidine kinase/CheY-like chemotaxis protein